MFRRLGAGGELPLRFACPAILVLALAVRLSVAFTTQAFQEAAYGEPVRVARSIVEQGVFGNPFNTPTGPTAHVAPAWGYVLAGMVAIVPKEPGLSITLNSLSLVVASLVWALLPLAAAWLSLPRGPGLLGGVMGAANPLRHWSELNGVWESTLAALALMLLVSFTFHLRDRLGVPRVACAIGMGWGALALLHPGCSLVFLFFLGVGIWEGWRGRREALAASAAGALAFLLVITPWTVRNYVRFGGLTFIRSNLGLELGLAFHDGAEAHVKENLHSRLDQIRHPKLNRAEARRLVELGELRYHRMRLQEAWEWIAANPGRAARLTLERLAYFWVPRRERWALRAVEALLFGLAAAGLGWMWIHREAAACLLAGVWLIYPPVYYLVQADERYRYPIEWTVALLAGYTCWRAWEHWRRRRGVAGERKSSPVSRGSH